FFDVTLRAPAAVSSGSPLLAEEPSPETAHCPTAAAHWRCPSRSFPFPSLIVRTRQQRRFSVHRLTGHRTGRCAARWQPEREAFQQKERRVGKEGRVWEAA